MVVTGFWLRRASCAVPTWNEWWVTVASAIWTAICSWRQKLLNRRSRRRTAEPPEETNGGARAAMERSPARVSTKITLARNTCEPRCLVVVVVVVVALRCREVVVTWCCEIVRHGVVGCLTVWVLLSCCCGLGPLSLGGAIGGVHCSAVFNFLHWLA